MKNLKTFLLLFAAAVLFPLAAQELVISENGRSHAEIVTGKNPSAVVQFAAKELSYFLGKAGKCTVPVKTQSNAKIQFHLGATPESRKAGISPKDHDHIISIRKDGKIFLAGVDEPQTRGGTIYNLFFNIDKKGTLETVYTFLEKYLGIRFLEPGKEGEFIPVKNKLVLRTAEENIRPAFHERRTHYYRGVSYTSTYKKTIPDLDEYGGSEITLLWGLRLRYTSFKSPAYGCHTYVPLYFSDLLKSKPEMFSMLEDGSRTPNDLCWSNPDVEEQWFKFADSWFSGDKTMKRAGVNRPWNITQFPRRNEFMIDPHDYQTYFCQCERCKKLRAPHGEQGQGELIWKVIFNVARRVEKAYPGKLITTLVYPPKRFVPQDKNVPKNLRVRITLPWAGIVPRTPPRDECMRLMKDWTRIIGEKTYVWQYFVADFASQLHGIPEIATRNMQNLIKEYRPYVQGVFFEHIETSHTIRNQDQYMFAHLLWNPDIDLEKELSAFYRNCFGSAAPEMAAFSKRIEQNWYKVAQLHAKELLGGRSPHLVRIFDTIYTYDEIIALEKMLDAASRKVPAKSVYAKRIDRYRRFVLNMLKEEFSLHATDKSRTFKKVQYLDLPVLKKAPQEKDWENTPWRYLHSDDKALKVHKASRFKVFEADNKIYLRVRLDDPQIALSNSKVRAKGIFTNFWFDNISEVFLTGKSGNPLHIAVNDLGQWGVFRDKKHGFDIDVPGISIKVSRDDKGWGYDAVIDHSAPGYSSKSAADCFNVTRTIAHKGKKERINFTWSRDAVGRWGVPGCHSRVRRIKAQEQKMTISGLARSVSSQKGKILLAAKDSTRARGWSNWKERRSAAIFNWTADGGISGKACRSIDYKLEGIDGKEKSASWRFMTKVPANCKALRFALYLRAETVNPNAAAQLHINWNNKKGRWVSSSKPITGTVEAPIGKDWKKIQVEIPVPDNKAICYVSITIGSLNVRPGKLLFDGLQIEALENK